MANAVSHSGRPGARGASKIRNLVDSRFEVVQTMQTETGRQVAVALYLVAMVAVIVGLDVAFFRNRFWERLMANIGVVLVFLAFYLRFLGRP